MVVAHAQVARVAAVPTPLLWQSWRVRWRHARASCQRPQRGECVKNLRKLVWIMDKLSFVGCVLEQVDGMQMRVICVCACVCINMCRVWWEYICVWCGHANESCLRPQRGVRVIVKGDDMSGWGWLV